MEGGTAAPKAHRTKQDSSKTKRATAAQGGRNPKAFLPGKASQLRRERQVTADREGRKLHVPLAHRGPAAAEDKPPAVVVVAGAAGSGKTTLIRCVRAAREAAAGPRARGRAGGL